MTVMNPKIKICGITLSETVEVLNQTKPDYAGFVFAKSQRQVTPQQAENLTARLDFDIGRVGVFVNAEVNFVTDTARRCGLNMIQLHGDESPEYARLLREKTDCEIWRAIRVKDSESLLPMQTYPADRFLLDAYLPNAYGGGGSSFNWDLLREIDTSQIILAGGLNIENISEAIRRVSPFGVDISSGVETNGRKDPQKIEKMIRGVRNE